MNQKGQPQRRRLYALPIVAGFVLGYVVAERIDLNGLMGALTGAFIVDALRGLYGTHRLAIEAEHLIEQAREMWRERKSAAGQSASAESPAGDSESSLSWRQWDES